MEYHNSCKHRQSPSTLGSYVSKNTIFITLQIVSYCTMLPLLNESSPLKIVNITHNPMYCDCHLVWIEYTTATVIHSLCMLPGGWRSTQDVSKLCPTTHRPTCGKRYLRVLLIRNIYLDNIS